MFTKLLRDVATNAYIHMAILQFVVKHQSKEPLKLVTSIVSFSHYTLGCDKILCVMMHLSPLQSIGH